MADRDDSLLDKVENKARRILERLGAKLDNKLDSRNPAVLSHHQVGDLAGRIEQAIEANLRLDENGVKRIAPNRLAILLTYEGTSEIADGYLEALAGELKTAALEYINDRRYEMRGSLLLEVRRDLFATSTAIKATFEHEGPASLLVSPADQAAAGRSHSPGARSVARQTIHLMLGDREYKLVMSPDGGVRSVGRAVGSALRIDEDSVSRLHCSLALRRTGEIVISDLGSANGTSLNGEMLGTNDARPLNPGDVIRVGDVRLSVAAIESTPL